MVCEIRSTLRSLNMSDELIIDDDKKKNKKPKKIGPIRTGAVFPFFGVTAVTVLFSYFLLDYSIQKTLEIIGGELNNAEVNIGSVETSFSELRVSVHDIEVTNRDTPSFNKIFVGKMEFELHWDALLRGKILVNLANIGNIKVNTKREKPGDVYPVNVDSKTGNNAVAQKMLDKAKGEFKGNVFGDIAGILGGGSTGDMSDEIKNSLVSKKRFEELSLGLKNKEKKINADMKKLPNSAEIKKLQARIKKIKWKDLGNLMKAPGILKEADSINKEIQRSIKAAKQINNNVNSSLKEIDAAYKDADSLIAQDINSVSKRMNLPTLDQKSMGRMLFGDEVLGKIEEAKKYQVMAQEYMPVKKDPALKRKKPKRGAGRDYRFGTPKSYPLFWLKLAKIDSKNEQGSVIGRIENLTNNQNTTGVLTTAKIKAHFPKMDIHHGKFDMELDHRESPVLKLSGIIANIPVNDKELSNTKDAVFIIKNANNHVNMQAVLTESKLEMKLKNRLTKIKYETKSANSSVAEVLSNVARKTKVLTLDAKVKGQWDSLNFDIKSNLVQAINSTVRSLVKEKIEKAQAKIKLDIEKQISASKGKVDKQVSALKNSVNSKLGNAKKQMDQMNGQLKSEKKKAEKKAKKSIMNPLKKLKIKGLSF